MSFWGRGGPVWADGLLAQLCEIEGATVLHMVRPGYDRAGGADLFGGFRSYWPLAHGLEAVGLRRWHTPAMLL